jgi:hypothetical protein
MEMRRLFGLLAASCAVLAALLAAFGIPGTGGSTGPAVASAASPAQQIGMRVLLITTANDTTSAAGIAYNDWVNTLTREGVPYDSVVTNASSLGSVPLPALSSTAANGTQVANYEGVVVATSGTSGLSAAQWTTLQTFEQHFSVRQVTAYAVPSSDYGLVAANPPVSFSGSPSPGLTAAGQTVFPYLNAVAFDAGTFGYEGTPAAGANVSTLISGPNGSSLLGVYTTPDGRQTMFQTFNQNQYMLQSQLLRHGELDWLARNTYFGDQRNYLETNIDDNFLSDDSYTPGTGVGGGSTDYNPANALRETPADITTAANWSAANNFRIDMLFNGGGSTGATDPLVTQFKADRNDFGWINHTWDHPNLDQGCANQTFIQNEITQNTSWATTTLGLGTSSTSPLGNQDPGAIVTGEHSGLANLIPGNPGTVDPPEFNAVTAGTATPATTLVAGTYTYAITDDFVPGGGQSSASETTVAPTAAGQQVAITWDAVCHAADYYIYRLDPGATTWTLVHSQPAAAADFGNTGPVELSFTDTNLGTAPATTPPSTTVNAATETPYEQNTGLAAAFTAIGIKDFGSDASKPYPNPPATTFTTGTTPASELTAGSTFSDGGATAIPRYPTNIYYNASTEAQEVNEYETIYDSPTCVPITGVTTCNAAGTTFTMSQIVASVDQNMFLHMMGNDPRPHYFHQTNLMGPSTTVASTGTPPATAPATGDGLYYETMNPLLAQYHQYFAANAPIEQPTMSQIGTLLTDQATWTTDKVSQVTGSIEGNVVTVDNTTGGAVDLPLTGTTGGTPYAGSESYWTSAPAGLSTYTALAAWPAPPTVPVDVIVPSGPAPGNGHNPPIPPTGGGKPAPPATAISYFAVQATPKTVTLKQGTATVSLTCRASLGRTPKGKFCSGSLALNVSGQTVRHTFRFKSGRTDRIKVSLNKRMRTMAANAHRQHKTSKRKLSAKLVITTKLSGRQTHVARGVLTIRT